MISSLPTRALRPKVRAKLFGKLRKSVDDRVKYAAVTTAGALPLYHTMDDDMMD